ncbi:DUF2225 domain-containing protein [Mangrovibacillus cuniculi]|uniref:DUF2225 domain-containing protein n=1 Tax=Mangrovibacillus cuniculi TaxID=2593652 RepID=A0A7S8HFY0_9BACI|nr:DUF2225 domain-containing protein [Mangrovibacillus cuniculi]QPC47374.1 DUF2225 domain-containing protein [Mangrovibacillus cuniculi]
MESISPLFDRTISCPLCKTTYKTKKIRSRFVKIEKHESDFRPIYSDPSINPTYYNVHVCSSCGYSHTDEFSKHMVPVIKSELEQKISAHWQKQYFGEERSTQDAIRAYKLAIINATIKREKKVTLAGLFLRVAWLYRELNQEEEEQRFLKLSASCYEESYLNDDFSGTQMSDVKVLYMIAELSRRCGNETKAVKYLSKVIEKQNTTTDRKIIDMAKEQWYEYRENRKKEQAN